MWGWFVGASSLRLPNGSLHFRADTSDAPFRRYHARLMMVDSRMKTVFRRSLPVTEMM